MKQTLKHSRRYEGSRRLYSRLRMLHGTVVMVPGNTVTLVYSKFAGQSRDKEDQLQQTLADTSER